MKDSTSARAPLGRLAAFAGWAAIAVSIGGYVALSAVGTPASVLAAQFFYVLPIAASTALCFVAALQCRRASREGHTWLLVGIALSGALLGESSFAYLQVTGQLRPDSYSTLADIGYGVAGLAMLCLLTVVSDVWRLERPARVRVLADVVVLLALVVGFIAELLPRLLPADMGVDTTTIVFASIYTALSLVIAMIGFALWNGTRTLPAPPWTTILCVALFVYAAGVLVWPYWHASQFVLGGPLGGVVAEVLYLAGYGLVGVAAAQRIASRRAWEQPEAMALVIEERETGQLALASVVFVAVSALAVFALNVPSGSPAGRVAGVTLAIAAAGIVTRSSAMSFEREYLRSLGLRDAVTGVGNQRRFESQLADLSVASRTTVRPLALALVDIDGFAAVNEALGSEGGDRALARVASALTLAAPTGAAVCRLGGDTFALLALGLDAEATGRLAVAARDAVETVEVDGRPLSGSVGYASIPRDSDSGVGLRLAAEAALGWAKRTGRGRIVGYRSGMEPSADAGQQVEFVERQSALELARGLAVVADTRSPVNQSHSRNVAAYSVLLGRSLGMDEARLTRLETAALLHDIGTIALSDDVLDSTARSAALRRREHAELGERFCRSIGYDDVASLVRSHHEMWDGGGFPDGLAGEQIPLESRIMALADALDLLCGGAAGAVGLSRGAALQEIDLGIGRRFDPELTERFIEVVGEHGALGWSDEGVRA